MEGLGRSKSSNEGWPPAISVNMGLSTAQLKDNWVAKIIQGHGGQGIWDWPEMARVLKAIQDKKFHGLNSEKNKKQKQENPKTLKPKTLNSGNKSTHRWQTHGWLFWYPLWAWASAGQAKNCGWLVLVVRPCQLFLEVLPSGNLTLLLKMVIYSGFSHRKSWFPIVMLVYQRVTIRTSWKMSNRQFHHQHFWFSQLFNHQK